MGCVFNRDAVTAMKNKENVVKMQKLRRTLDRLRNIRSSGTAAARKVSWLTRLKIRLGLATSEGAEE